MAQYKDIGGRVGARTWPLLAPAALLVIVVAAATAGPASLERTATVMVINVVFVVGLYIFVGNSGVVSFGHASFMAIGAYTSALLTVAPATKAVQIAGLPGFLVNADWATIPAALIAGVCAALFALVVGIPLMRLSGLAAGIATLALLIIVNVVIREWESLTGGTKTMVGVPTDTTLFGAVVWAVIAMAVAFLYQESRFGLRLRSSREDELAAKAIGVNVVRERLLAFMLSAFFTGVGGALYGHFLGVFAPTTFFFSITFLVIAMLVVGGINSLAGATVGVIVISGVAEGLRRVEAGIDLGFAEIPSRRGVREVGLGIVLLLILLLRPSGITGSKEIVWPFTRWAGERRPSADARPAVQSANASTGADT